MRNPSKGNDDKTKAPIEYLFEAYKIGGFPFAMFILGAVCLLAAVGLTLSPASSPASTPVVQLNALLIVGGGIVAVGGLVWGIALHLRTRFQVAVLRLISGMSRDAAMISKDGANFKVALEDLTSNMPKLLKAIGSASPEHAVAPQKDGENQTH